MAVVDLGAPGFSSNLIVIPLEFSKLPSFPFLSWVAFHHVLALSLILPTFKKGWSASPGTLLVHSASTTEHALCAGVSLGPVVVGGHGEEEISEVRRD